MSESKLYILLLALVAVTVWLAVLLYPEPELRLVACDVGQGDAILATHGRTQILVDGGPDNSVLDCLGKHMPFWDREIELVVITHPQKDHFGGIIDVFKAYEVQTLLTNELGASSSSYGVLKNLVGGSGTEVVVPTSGIIMRIGKIYLEIVHPSEEFLAESASPGGSSTFGSLNPNSASATQAQHSATLGSYASSRDPNDFSVVAILRLEDFDALLTGDIGPDVMGEVLGTDLLRDVEYIKVPHHGSKNGLTQELLEVSEPEIAVISAGRGNRYGHPHQEVLDLLDGVRVLRTDEVGDVVVGSDGESWWLSE